MTRGSDNNRNLLCARDVFPNGPRHGPAMLFVQRLPSHSTMPLYIRECHFPKHCAPFATGAPEAHSSIYQPRNDGPASRMTGSHSCSYTLGTRRTVTASGGLCCKTSASDS